MLTEPTRVVAYAAVVLAMAGLLRHLWDEARDALKGLDARDAAAGAGVILAVAVATACASGLPVRGGHNNEHDFAFMASRFLPLGHGIAPDLGEKNLSTRAFLALIDFATGRSLDGFLAAQKVLWALNALLAFAFMRRLGATRAGAMTAALLAALHAYSILAANDFSDTLIGLFYLHCGLNAAAALTRAQDADRALRAWRAFLCAAALVFAARFEFLAVLLLAVCAGTAATRAAWPRALIARRVPAAAYLALAAVSMAACALASGSALWFEWSGLHPWRNLAHHLGSRNLTALTGLPPAGAAAAAALLIVAAPAVQGRGRRAGALFASLWAAFFACGYLACGHFFLMLSRHHLYVMLPFAAAAGWLVSALGPRGAAAVVLLVPYLALNLALVSARSTDLRTNDKEWGFLLSARRAWPADCGALFPFRHSPAEEDTRSALLAKYFPPPRPGGCVLLYRSPRTSVIDMSPPRYAPYDDAVDTLYGRPWRESVFRHRPYTDWHGPWQAMKAERLAPLRVAAGFHHPSETGEAALKAAPARGGLYTVSPPPDTSAVPAPSGVWPEPTALMRCYNLETALLVDPHEWGEELSPRRALHCLDLAPAAADRRAEAEHLFHRANALEALGRRREAARSLNDALALDATGWPRVAAARRRSRQPAPIDISRRRGYSSKERRPPSRDRP